MILEDLHCKITIVRDNFKNINKYIIFYVIIFLCIIMQFEKGYSYNDNKLDMINNPYTRNDVIYDSEGKIVLAGSKEYKVGMLCDENTKEQKLLYKKYEKHILEFEKEKNIKIELIEDEESNSIAYYEFYDLDGKKINLNIYGMANIKIYGSKICYAVPILKEFHIYDLVTKEDINMGEYDYIYVDDNVMILTCKGDDLIGKKSKTSFFKNDELVKDIDGYMFEKAVDIDNTKYYKIFKYINYWKGPNKYGSNDFFERKFYNLVNANCNIVLDEFIDEENEYGIGNDYKENIDYEEVLKNHKVEINPLMKTEYFYDNVYNIVKMNDNIIYSCKKDDKYYLVNDKKEIISDKYDDNIISMGRFVDNNELVYTIEKKFKKDDGYYDYTWDGKILHYLDGKVKEYDVGTGPNGNHFHFSGYGYYTYVGFDQNGMMAEAVIKNFLEDINPIKTYTKYYWIDTIKFNNKIYHFGRRVSGGHKYDLFSFDGNLITDIVTDYEVKDDKLIINYDYELTKDDEIKKIEIVKNKNDIREKFNFYNMVKNINTGEGIDMYYIKNVDGEEYILYDKNAKKIASVGEDVYRVYELNKNKKNHYLVVCRDDSCKIYNNDFDLIENVDAEDMISFGYTINKFVNEYNDIAFAENTKVIDELFNIYEKPTLVNKKYELIEKNNRYGFMDITTGKMIVDNLKLIYDNDEEYALNDKSFCYLQGFKYGKMDYDGNVIVSFSIFDDIIDETGYEWE